MQILTGIDQRDPELEHEIGCPATDLSRATRWPITPAPVCAAGGKPSTWLPPGELAEQLDANSDDHVCMNTTMIA